MNMIIAVKGAPILITAIRTACSFDGYIMFYVD